MTWNFSTISRCKAFSGSSSRLLPKPRHERVTHTFPQPRSLGRPFSWRHENGPGSPQPTDARPPTLIIYTSEDGKSRILLRADENTVWLTQLEMADLFATTKQNVSLHLQNIFEDGELQEAATVKESLTVQIEGGREVQRPVMLYNLDATKKANAGRLAA